jgi:hypothetical protein
MRTRSIVLIAILLTAAIVVSGIALGQDDQGPAPAEPAEPFEVSVSDEFTYQGQLKSGGSPYDGKCDLRFKLYNASTGGSQIGSTQTKTNKTVTDGRFTVSLNFGNDAFQGPNRWLLIAVRCPAGSGSYTTLTPRQKLTASPYALYAKNAGTAASATIADTADYANDSDRLDNKSSGFFASKSALNSHDHMVAMASSSGLGGINSSTNVEVMNISLDIPDKCSGANPIDQWNIMVTANGNVWTNSAQIYAELGVSIDDDTNYVNDSQINITLGGPITTPDFITSFNIEWLFTNIDSGSHIFHLLASEFGGDASYTVFLPRLIVQAMGYTCTNSLNLVEDGTDQVNDVDLMLDPTQLITPDETGSGQ